MVVIIRVYYLKSIVFFFFFFFKQKTAYEMRISDWSSDVCSSDLALDGNRLIQAPKFTANLGAQYSWHPSIGEITLRGEMNYMSLIYFTAYNQDSVAQPGNTKFNAFLGFTDKDSHWNASLFIDRKSTRLNSSHYCASHMPS